MKPLPVLILLLVSAGCADIPELDGSETRQVRSAAYPRLVPLDETMGAPANPVNEAAQIEEELTARSEELAKRAQVLQNAATN